MSEKPRSKRLVALLGYAGVGKSTGSDLIQKNVPSVRDSFAAKLRYLLREMDWPVQVSNNGSTIGFKTLCDEYGYDAAKKTYPQMRPLLVRLGEALRKNIDPMVWIDAVFNTDTEKLPNYFSKIEDEWFVWKLVCSINGVDKRRTPFDRDFVFRFRSVLRLVFLMPGQPCEKFLIIDDCRYPNESKKITELGGIVIRIDKPGVGPANETEAASIKETPFTHYIDNNGSIEEFQTQIMDLIENYRITGR